MTTSKKRVVYFGPPGTGKTSKLMELMSDHLSKGVAPERVGFISFSRRAIKEARDRATEIVGKDAELPHFRTIHSTAYHLAELSRGDVIQEAHMEQFADAIGLPFKRDVDDPLWEGQKGNQCLGLYGLARARGTTLEQEWQRASIPDLPWELVNPVINMYETFKRSRDVLDFHDMLEAGGTLDVDVLFIDEAQDNTPAQWAFIRRVAAGVPTIYMAGDDDQAIYAWSGADAGQLMRFRAAEKIVLPHSFRLPIVVKRLCDRIASHIHQRHPKSYTSKNERGQVNYLRDADLVDLRGKSDFLLLARSHYQLRVFRTLARQQGVVYTLPNGDWSWTLPAVQAAIAYERLRKGDTVDRPMARLLTGFLGKHVEPPVKKRLDWDDVCGPTFPKDRNWMEALATMSERDREYVRALRRGKESLNKPGRVRIGTIHSVKGTQAAHVVLLTDISERVLRGSEVDPDAERRVQYVAASRASETLTLIQPNTQNHWGF